MEVTEILNRAKQLRREGQLTEAARCYSDAAKVYRQANDEPRLAHALRHVGDIELEQGRLAEAEPNYRVALAIYRSLPQAVPLDLANCLRGCALLQEALACPEAAAKLWREAGALYQSVGVEAGVAESKVRILNLEGNC